MRRYKIFIFLLSLSISLPSWACIDDPDDYDYWMEGGELDEVICIGHYGDDEEDGSSLDDYDDEDDDDSIQLPEVICTGHQPDNDDTNDNDNDNDDNNDDDFGWNWDEDDDQIIVAGNNSSSKKYKLKKSDKLVKPFTKMPKAGYRQALPYSCLPAGLVFASILYYGKEYDEGTIMKMFIDRTKSFEVVFGIFNSETISTDISDVANQLGFDVTEDVFNLKEAIDEGRIVLTNIDTEISDQTHDIIIVGYNDEGFIGYDTDKDAGYYRQITSDNIHGTYSISMKSR